jgi:phage terminase small subunit
MTPKKPPKHLTRESKAIWRSLNTEWELGTSELLLLKTSLEAYDRLNAARMQIDTEGPTIISPSGLIKPHPCLKIEKESRAGFLQAWRMLNLDVEPPGTVGRPPGT